LLFSQFDHGCLLSCIVPLLRAAGQIAMTLDAQLLGEGKADKSN
jgi:hypothetical protein